MKGGKGCGCIFALGRLITSPVIFFSCSSVLSSAPAWFPLPTSQCWNCQSHCQQPYSQPSSLFLVGDPGTAKLSRLIGQRIEFLDYRVLRSQGILGLMGVVPKSKVILFDIYEAF